MQSIFDPLTGLSKGVNETLHGAESAGMTVNIFLGNYRDEDENGSENIFVVIKMFAQMFTVFSQLKRFQLYPNVSAFKLRLGLKAVEIFG